MNNYKILGLDPNRNWTKQDIRKAFLKKAKKLHPDHNKSPNAEKEFKELYKAYQTLFNRDSNLNSNSNSNSNLNSNNRGRFVFDFNMHYWLNLIFGDNMPSHIQNGIEPTGIFGPPYN